MVFSLFDFLSIINTFNFATRFGYVKKFFLWVKLAQPIESILTLTFASMEIPIAIYRASSVLKNSETVYPACRKRRLLGIYQLQLTANSGVASLDTWLDHHVRKLRLGVSKGMLPVEEFCSNKSP